MSDFKKTEMDEVVRKTCGYSNPSNYGMSNKV